MVNDELRALLAQGRRTEAARRLVDAFAGDVLGLCRAMVRERATAEDLAQDSFQRALSNLDDYRGDASPRTWLLAIARNRCLDHLRRAGRSPWGLTDADAPEAAAIDPAPLAPELLSRRADLERALASLDEATRALIVLRFRHGLGYPELADSFGIGQGAVRMRVSRALATMRAALEPPLVARAPMAAPSPAAPARQRRRGGAPMAPPGAASAPRAVPVSAPLRFGDVLGACLEPPSAAFRDRLTALVSGV